MEETNCREEGVGTVGTFNDRELQVMAGNAPYLTPPPHLIPSHEITPAASPLIFSYRRRAPLFRLTSHCTSTRDSYLHTLLVRPNYYASRTQFRPCEEGDNVPLGLHAYALRTRLRGMGLSRSSMNLFPFRLVVFDSFLFDFASILNA